LFELKPRAAIQADPDNDPDPGRRGQVFMQREEVGGREFKWHLSGKSRHAAAAAAREQEWDQQTQQDRHQCSHHLPHIESITPDSELKY